MTTVTVQSGQTFFDIVLMACGTMQGCMAIAAANDLSISDEVTPGQEIVIPDGVAADFAVLKYYKDHKIIVGTKVVVYVSGGFISEPGTDTFETEDTGEIFVEE